MTDSIDNRLPDGKPASQPGWVMVEIDTLQQLFGYSHNDYSSAIRKLRIKLHEATS